jgi:hypothetical protein
MLTLKLLGSLSKHWGVDQWAENWRHNLLAAIIHRGRIFALVRAARGAHDLHAQPEFSPQG